MAWPFSRRRNYTRIENLAESVPPLQGVSGIPWTTDGSEIPDDLSFPTEVEAKSGFFSRLFGNVKTTVAQARSEANQSMALVAPWLSGVIWTISRAYFALAREAYGSNGAVYSTLRLLAESVGEPPLIPYEISSSLIRDELDFNAPLYKIIRKPNPLMTTFEFVELSVIHMGIVGRVHWWKERDRMGHVINLWPLRPDRVGPLYAIQPVMAYNQSPFQPQNELTGAASPLESDNRVLSGWAYWPPGVGKPIKIPLADVVTINLPDPAGETGGLVEGLGAVQVLAREIEADNEATSFVAALLKNFAMPGAILHVKANLMRDKVALFKREWKKTFGGTRRGDIAVFDGDTTFQEVGFNLQQLEFPNVRRVTEARIAAAFGIPAVLVGFAVGVESANRSTLAEFREYFAETTLPSWWRRIQEALTRDLAPDFGDSLLLEFDLSKVKALTLQSSRQIQPFQLAFQAGAITIDEYRLNVLGLPPLPDGTGNVLLIPNVTTPQSANINESNMENTVQGTDSPLLGGEGKPSQEHDEDPRTQPMTIRKPQRGAPRIQAASGSATQKSIKVSVIETWRPDAKIPWLKHRWLEPVYEVREIKADQSKKQPLPKNIPADAQPFVDAVMAEDADSTNRPERRFLVPSVVNVMAQLEKRTATVRSLRQYDVSTLYLDVPGGSWSVGDNEVGYPKMRWRHYLEDSGNSYFELKWTNDGQSSKRRVICDDPPEGLEQICTITYTRIEWETNSLRITVDDNIRTDANSEEMDTRRLPFYVVEIKGQLPFWLNFLKPYEVPKFSKTKWALNAWKVPTPIINGKMVYRGFSIPAEQLGLAVGAKYLEAAPVVVSSDRGLVQQLVGEKGCVMGIVVPESFEGPTLEPCKLTVKSFDGSYVEAEYLEAA